jgi:hypothetical protein
MSALGQRVWVVPGGRIPWPSNGEEPEFTGFDQLCILNTGDEAAEVTVTIYYDDGDPAGPYRWTVGACRVRQVRFNDLVDPEALRLGRPFGCVVQSQVPVVVQFVRQDTRIPGGIALMTTMAFPAGS